MLVLALVFLFEAWIWQGCVALGRKLVTLIPWAALKSRIVAFVDLLPAPVALLIFLIPVAIVEPFKVVCLALIAERHWILGIFGLVLIESAGVGLIAVAFDLTRHRLLTMPWFVWVYERFAWIDAAAHGFVAPYKVAAREAMRAVVERGRRYWMRVSAARAETDARHDKREAPTLRRASLPRNPG
jgi:hypothetical protein